MSRDSQFVVDPSLKQLGRILRMLGQDVELSRETDPAEIFARARAGGRILLVHGSKWEEVEAGSELFSIDSPYPFHQAREVVRAFELSIDPDRNRCPEDNALLIREAEGLGLRCVSCGESFQPGGHLDGMRGLFAELSSAPLARREEMSSSLPKPGSSTLDVLLDLHQAFEVRFSEHRLALMAADLQLAREKFDGYAAWLRDHVEQETAAVLPVYAAARQGFERGAAPEVFESEHQKILDHLTGIDAMLGSLQDRALPPERLRLECLHLLDREKIFVDLCEHHDHRERLYLYPTLEQLLSEPEKRSLVDRMLQIPA